MFEKTYIDSPPQERAVSIEKHISIEKPDIAYLTTAVINEPAPILMQLDMPILEKQISKGNKNAKSTRKSTKEKPLKIPPKSHQTAMAGI